MSEAKKHPLVGVLVKCQWWEIGRIVNVIESNDEVGEVALIEDGPSDEVSVTLVPLSELTTSGDFILTR